MNNVVPFKIDDEAIEETSSLVHLCRTGSTRCFVFHNRLSDELRLFALLHHANDQFVLYAQSPFSDLFHFETIVAGGLPEAIKVAAELMGSEWSILPA